MSVPPVIHWERMRAVLFDVDGTLYCQKCMRWRMAMELGRGLLTGRITPRQVHMLSAFRRNREHLSRSLAVDVTERQFTDIAARFTVSPELVRGLVEDWMLRNPLRHLAACRFDGLRDFIDGCRARGLAIGVLSDYPAEEKLCALGVEADLIVVATDPGIGRLKPEPTGLMMMLERMGLTAEQALYIGDRDEVDGEVARKAGMTYLIIGRRGQFQSYRSLTGLLSER